MAITPESFSFGPWAIGDSIVGPAVVPYLEGDEPADFTGIAVGSGRLTDPTGATSPVTVAVDDTELYALAYTLEGDDFTVAGIYALTAELTVAAGTFRTVEAHFVVEAVEGWATTSSMRSTWRDAPESDVALWRLLEVARGQVEAYAPDRDVVGSTIPRPSTNLVLAQTTQARNIWNAVKSDPANQGIGDEGFVIRPFPMDWTVKNLIRPQRATPVIA